MWKGTALFKSEDDFSLADLRQENLTLRNELSILYGKLLENDEAIGRKKMSVVACQTDTHLAFHIPDVHEKVGGLATDLSHQRALNVEQANRAKESERRIRDCESKILDMNMELLQTVPIKARVVDLMQQNEQLQAKISSAANDFINLSVEVNHHKATAEKLIKDLHVKEAEIAAMQEQSEQQLAEARRKCACLLCFFHSDYVAIICWHRCAAATRPGECSAGGGHEPQRRVPGEATQGRRTVPAAHGRAEPAGAQV
jgi:chromosome segregation ATPase